MSRDDLVLRMIDKKQVGLEIGPSHAPLAPKRRGFNVRTVDHATREELVAKYRQYGVDEEALNAIEEVDYVWTGQPLGELIGDSIRFDYILASHVTEHTTDVVGFLNGCSQILAPDGVVCLFVPDKRFCFDRFRPLTSLGEVYQASKDPRPVHPVATHIDQNAYHACRNGIERHWSPEITDNPQLTMADWGQVRKIIEHAESTSEYIDTHRWTFTPTSFLLMLTDLHDLGLIDLGVKDLVDVGTFEFLAVLSHSGQAAAQRGDRASRLAMMLQIERELAAQAGLSVDTDMQAALVSARAELATIRASYTWRATQPLRTWRHKERTKDMIRRLRRRLR